MQNNSSVCQSGVANVAPFLSNADILYNQLSGTALHFFNLKFPFPINIILVPRTGRS
jgi:hypothetical protein